MLASGIHWPEAWELALQPCRPSFLLELVRNICFEDAVQELVLS
jgi:hypothetical protein